MLFPSSLVISQRWGLIDLPLRTIFSPAHPPTRRQTFITRPTLRLLRNRFPETCH